MYNGSCLCGKVKFTIRGAISDIVYCHCSQCRKANGSAYATNGVVNTDDFQFNVGEEMLSSYEYGKGLRRYFCNNCGSPIISKRENNPNIIRVRLGVIESDIVGRPARHIFVGSKANWDSITDHLPQHEAFL